MKPFLLLVLVLMFGLPQHSGAQTNAPKAPPKRSNRYLIIVETSRSMEKRAEGTMKVVNDLLESGMGGKLQKGDTLGLWTFNEHLYAGRFPLQLWTPETHKNVAQKLWNYLKEQPYEKAASLEPVLAGMHAIINNSEVITVILISDGEQP